MWEDSSCCFHCFELEDCPHLTGKTAQLLSGRRGMNPQIFFLKIVSRDAYFDSVLLIYCEGGHKFQWWLGTQIFLCSGRDMVSYFLLL